MAKTATDIKKEMTLPPIPQQASKNHGNRERNRTRVRLEISADQGHSFVSMLADKLRGISIDDPNFKSLYAVYFQLKSQLEKLAVTK